MTITDSHPEIAETAALPTFRILCVCTGNICRSPVAERLLRKTFGPEVAVTSAGTHALAGQPIAPPMAALLELAGGDPDKFVARQLTPELLNAADLVLTMTREQRSVTVELLPRAVRRTFTLAQFARLLSDVDPERLEAVPAPQRWAAAIPLAAAQQRAIITPEDDDIVDPYGGSEALYSTSFAQVETAVRAVVAALTT